MQKLYHHPIARTALCVSINIKDGEPTQKIPALKPAAARPVPAFSCSPPPSVGHAPFSPFPRRPFSLVFSPAPFFSRPTPPRPGPRAQSRPPLRLLPSFPNFPGRGLSPRLPASRSFRPPPPSPARPLLPSSPRRPFSTLPRISPGRRSLNSPHLLPPFPPPPSPARRKKRRECLPVLEFSPFGARARRKGASCTDAPRVPVILLRRRVR